MEAPQPHHTGVRVQRTMSSRSGQEDRRSGCLLLGLHPVPGARDHPGRCLSALPQRHLPGRGQERMRRTGRRLHVPGQYLVDRARRLLHVRCPDGAVRPGGVHQVQQHPGHHGVRQGALLRADGRHAHVLSNDVRDGRQTVDVHLHSFPRRTRTVSVGVLRGSVYENKPHIAHIQPRAEGDGEASELHEPALAVGHLLLSRLRAGHRRGHVGRYRPAPYDTVLSGS